MKKIIAIIDQREGKHQEKRERLKERFETEGYDVVTPYAIETSGTPAAHDDLYHLAVEILGLSYCNVAYFCKGWDQIRWCRLINEVALQHGLDVMYEEEEDA